MPLGIQMAGALIALMAAVQEPAVHPATFTDPYFGFSIPLPHGVPYHDVVVPPGTPRTRILLALQGDHDVWAALVIRAVESEAVPNPEQSLIRPNATLPIRIKLAGWEFWRNELDAVRPEGKVSSIRYATGIVKTGSPQAAAYVLHVDISASDPAVLAELQRCVEHMSFLDPAPPSDGQPPLGNVAGSTYRNTALGLEYKFPNGWIVSDFRPETDQPPAGVSALPPWVHWDMQQCFRTMLWVTKFDHAKAKDAPNPSINLSLMNAACFAKATLPGEDRDRIATLQKMVDPDNKQLLSDTLGPGRAIIEHRMGRDQTSVVIFTQISKDGYWVALWLKSDSEAGLLDLRKTKVAFAPTP